MKKTLLLFSLLASSLPAFTQKVDLDELPVVTSYVHLPQNPLPIELTTYSCEFAAVGFNLQQIGYTAQNLSSTYFTLSGFRKLETGGHFIIKVQIDQPQVENIKEATQTDTRKDKDGKETKSTTYAYSFRYYVPCRYVITDYQRNIIQEGALSDGQQAHSFTTDYVATQAQSQENWKRNRDAILTERSRAYLSQTLSAFQSRLNNEFGYVPHQRQKINFWILNNAKHPEYEAYQQQYATMRATFDRMTPETGLDVAALKPAITYLEALPTRFAADEKADRKLRYSAYFNLGVLYYWLDDFDRAVQYADLLIKNDYDKRDGEALKEIANSAKTRLVANRMTSRHLLRDVSNASPPAVPAAILAQQAAEAADTKAKKDADAMEKVGNLIGQLNDIYGSIQKQIDQRKAAIKQLDSLLVKTPDDAKLYNNRGVLKQSIGDRTAISDIEKAVSLKPKEVSFIKNLGQASLQFGEYAKSVAAYDQALLLAPKNTDLILGRGTALSRATRYQDAIATFTQALTINPKSVEALNERGFAYDYLDQYDAALADFTKATKLNPKDPEARFGVGYVKTNMGRYEDALADYAEVLKLRAFFPRAYGNRALALARLGRTDEATKDIAQALQQDGQYANGYYVRAWMRTQAKNYQGALEDARQALAFRHGKAYKVYVTMGDALLGMGIAGEAIKQYDEALRIRPNYPDAVAGKQKATEVAAK